MHFAGIVLGLAIVAPVVLTSQTTTTGLGFEVATIKPNPGGRGLQTVDRAPTRLNIQRASLRFLIQWAYGIRIDQVVGPSWLALETYDLAATTAEPSTEGQLRQMLQTLLADRFQLTIHRETKSLPAYELRVAKDGPKMNEAGPEERNDFRATRSSYEFHHTSMSEFAERLYQLAAVDHPVIDRTGLTGAYDFNVQFPQGSRPAPTDANGVSTLDLVHRLGLQLALVTNPTEVVVVDHADKIPVEN